MINISDVQITPNTVTVGQSFTISVRAVDVSWDTIKQSFTDWNSVKTTLASWASVKNYEE